MAVYNYAGGEVNIKIVYYGPGLSGKTTNLEYMYSKLPRENKGKMVSMKTRTDRTLFFDFLPIEVGELNGMNVRFLLYTVPGQVYYNATRKLVLKGVDAVVFIADSSPDRLADDRDSLVNLEENLNEIGKSLNNIPWVIQYNKRDVEDCIPLETLERDLNTWEVPSHEAVATRGTGVYETFESIAKLVFKKLREELSQQKSVMNKREITDSDSEPISVEVVAQSSREADNSGTGESETSGYAEEREEEHESVSEFVDNVLKENMGSDDSIDLGATREGYEEYGHMVELGDNGKEVESVCDVEPSDTVESEEMEIINDPLDRTDSSAEQDDEPPVDKQDRCEDEKREKTITIPVVLTEEEINGETPIKVVLDIKVNTG
jgi:signal recognition particle receptor subunit beta